MTCIVSVSTREETYVGGDSCVSSDLLIESSPIKKVFRCGPLLIGYAGVIRVLNILQCNKFEIPASLDSLHSFVVNSFIPELQTLLVDRKVIGKSERTFDGEFLIAYGPNVITLNSDFAISAVRWPYMAIGSGGSIALGSLYSTERIEGFTPRNRLREALNASERHSVGVSRPFTILKTRRL